MSEETHPETLARERAEDELADAARQRDREQDFAYLATMALLVLRGDAWLHRPDDGSRVEGGSRIYHHGEHGGFRALGIPDVHMMRVATNVHVDFVACSPSELAEALLIEMATRR